MVHKKIKLINIYRFWTTFRKKKKRNLIKGGIYFRKNVLGLFMGGEGAFDRVGHLLGQSCAELRVNQPVLKLICFVKFEISSKILK